MAQEFGEIAEQFRRNGEAMRNYSWESKVEFQINGEVRNTELFEVSYDDEGRIHREPIEADGKRTKQQDIAETTLNSIRDLIDSYVHMSPDAFRAAFGDDPRSVRPGTGGEPTRIRGSNRDRPGRCHGGSRRPGHPPRPPAHPGRDATERVRYMSWPSFKEAQDGLTYAHRIVLTMQHKKKALRIARENYDLKPR